MNKKLAIGIISAALFLMTGCTNLGNSSSTSSPMSQEKIAAAVDINEEIYGIGSAPIEESGQGVAKMRASKDARDDIKAKISKQTKDVLKAYLVEIDFYSKKISDNVIDDLSEYITNNMLNETEEKDTWVENNKIYTVITLDRERIPVSSRDTFIAHIDSIVERLTGLRAEILAIPVEDMTPPQETEEVPVTLPEEVEDTENLMETTPVEEVSSLNEVDENFIDVQL